MMRKGHQIILFIKHLQSIFADLSIDVSSYCSEVTSVLVATNKVTLFLFPQLNKDLFNESQEEI